MSATPDPFIPLRLVIAPLFLMAVIFGVAWFLKRRGQFRVSTLLWIITLAAVILGWIFDRQRLQARIEHLQIELYKLQLEQSIRGLIE